MRSRTNLKVLILDTDYYAREALNGYLAWDRRTRVVHLADSVESLRAYVRGCEAAEWPDVVLLDPLAAPSPQALAALVEELERTIPRVMTLVLDRRLDLETVRAVARVNANGYLLRDEVAITIAWVIWWAQQYDFVLTRGVKEALRGEFDRRLFDAAVVPPRRSFERLTGRVRQALELYVVKGMSAQLTADEMGIAAHTVRDYIRQGYRILEEDDPTDPAAYPPSMSPQELAFVRFTALELGAGQHG